MGHRYKTAPSGSSNVVDIDGAAASRQRQWERARARIVTEWERAEAAAIVEFLRARKAGEVSRVWLDVRYRALKRDGGRCLCCGRSARDGIKLHVDHIKPISKYPKLALTLSNLQVLCSDCNEGKSNRDETDWRSL